jgi:hypothetical protein
MPDPLVILRAMTIAGVVAAVVLLALSWQWRSPHPARTALGWTIGVALALVVGNWALGLDLQWPPKEDRHRFLLLLLPAAVAVESIAAVPRIPRSAAWLLRVIVSLAAGQILLHGSVYLADPGEIDLGQWTTEQRILYFGGLALALIVVWGLLGLLLHVAPSRSVPLTLAVTCGGAAVTIMFSGSATDGQLGLVVAAALAGATAASFLLPAPPSGTAPIAIGVIGLFALLLGGRFFADLTWTHAVLLFAVPLLCWFAELPLIRELKPLPRAGLRILLVGLVVAGVAYQAQQASIDRSRPPSGDEEDSYEQYYR